MIFRILFLIVGILIIISGIDVFRNKAFHYFGYGIDLSNSSFSIGILITCFGVAFIYIASRKNFSFVKKENYLKCTQCGKIYNAETKLNKTCTDCYGELDDLEGFFIRHPGFKGQKGNKTYHGSSVDSQGRGAK